MPARSASFGIALLVSSILVGFMMTAVQPPQVESLSVVSADGDNLVLVRGEYRDQPLSLLLYEDPDVSVEFELPPLWRGESSEAWQGPFVLGDVKQVLRVDAVVVDQDSVYASVREGESKTRGIALFKAQKDLRGERVTGWSHERSYIGELPVSAISMGRIGNEIWIVGTDESGTLKCMVFDQAKIRPGGGLPLNAGKVTDTLVTQTSRGPLVAWIEIRPESEGAVLRWAARESESGDVVEGQIPDVVPGALSASNDGEAFSLSFKLLRDGEVIPGRAELEESFEAAKPIGSLALNQQEEIQSFVSLQSEGEESLMVCTDGRVHLFGRDDEGAWKEIYSPATASVGLAYFGSRFERVRVGLFVIGIGATLALMVMSFRRRDSSQSPEVPVERLASFPRRFAAGLIDLVLVAILYQFLMVYFLTLAENQGLADMWASPEFGQNIADNLVFRSLVDGMGTIFFFVVIGYHGIGESLWGRSLGKLFLSLRVVRQDGGRADVLACLVRSFFRVIEIVFLLGLLAFVFMLFTRRRQRLGDVMASTLVIDERAKLPPSQAPAQESDQVGTP